MDNKIWIKIISAKTKSGGTIDIPISGISMLPVLHQGDVITVARYDEYIPGDVLVFLYKDDLLLVHRLLKKDDFRYYCKGDNAFRLEDITEDQILGKVILMNGCPLPVCSEEFIALSYSVNREFFRCRYDIEKTKQSEIFLRYLKTLHGGTCFEHNT